MYTYLTAEIIKGLLPAGRSMAQHSMAGSADWARRSGWQSDDGGDGSGSEYGDGADGDGEEPPQPTTSNSPESAAEPGRGSGDGGAVNSRASSMQV